MWKAPQDIEDDEKKALIQRMRTSKAFQGTDLPALLEFLSENTDKLLSAADIEALHYKPSEKAFNPGRPRERVLKLKQRISRYQSDNPDEAIRVELPSANDAKGYQLRFERVTEAVSAVRRFWAAHLESGKDVNVICDPLLFFWDSEESMMVRFVDTNIEGVSRRAALAEFKRLHKKRFKDSLIPGHLYIDMGSVGAAEMIREHFRSAGTHVPLVLEKNANREWQKASPVVVGNLRTSMYLSNLFGSTDTKRLSYRLDAEKYGGIHIRDPRRKEAEAVKAIGAEMAADGKFMMPTTELTIGIVTRMPNPKGKGVLTIISSDGTYTTLQMAKALTTDSELRQVFNQMGWRLDQHVPATFEMMFTARLWPGDMDEEASDASLLFGRE